MAEGQNQTADKLLRAVRLTIRGKNNKEQHSSKAPEVRPCEGVQSPQGGTCVHFGFFGGRPAQQSWGALAAGEQKWWHVMTPVEPRHERYDIAMKHLQRGNVGCEFEKLEKEATIINNSSEFSKLKAMKLK